MTYSTPSIASLGTFKSASPQLRWPAFLNVADALCVLKNDQMRRTELSDPADVRAGQARQLGWLLKFAKDNVPFYGDRIPNTVFDDDGAVILNAFREIPILERAELQAAGTRICRRATADQMRTMIEFSTSGSTGMPVRVKWDRFANGLVQAMTVRSYLWAGLRPEAKFCSLRAVAMNPDGTSQQPRGNNWYPTKICGENAAFNATLPVSQQLEWLEAEKPNYLLTYPSNARALLQRARDHSADLSTLEIILTFGETMVDGLADLAREVCSARVLDRYSARECGTIALQCDEGAYHLMCEAAYVEVLDPSGAPVAPGETGRVVVTNLHNKAMPLIRYAIGDHAILGEACRCGRRLPTLSSVLGRTRNMLVLPNGDRFWPSFNSIDLNKVAPVRQFQLIQKSLEQIDVSLVVSREVTPDEEAALGAMLRERLTGDFNVDFQYVDEIPRSTSGKYEDFKSEIAD